MTRNPDSMHAPPRVQTRRLGDITLHTLEAGMVRLDGGAMFGVVPKPLWEKRIPADERNRIPLATRCVLVQTRDELVLLETGLGNKENEKFLDIYGVDNASSDPAYPDRLQQLIAEAGFRAQDVGVVIDTHLHFDHAGGNTYRDAEGQVRVSFPNARYHVQRGEWEWAHRNNERTSASYLPDNYDPVMAAGQLELLDGEVEIVPGISVYRTPGHCPHHQSVLLRSGGETACFLADVMPTFAHLPLPWIMGYDVEPLVTLETKRRILRRAVDERWLVVFEHDASVAWGRVTHDGKAY
ncbi:MAG TPA: MBL fold metallo-hydrolase, partial [Longimicrobium sp.]|nr:MBL fold metallo-hydrolase [Longimicrobium sp.]